MKKKKGIFDSCMFGDVYIYKYYSYIIYTIYILYTIDKIIETREKITDNSDEVLPRPNKGNKMKKTIKLRESKRAESPKSIAQGNALCNELHTPPSSPERAKSFVNNRLRPVIDCVKSSPVMTTLFKRLHASAHFQLSPVRVTQLIFNSMNNNSKQIDSYTVKRYIDQLLIINWLKFSIIFEEKPLIKKREVTPHENPLE